MGRHEAEPQHRANLKKVAGLAGMATAAAAMAMTVGAGTAQAGPLNDAINNIIHPNGTSTTNKQTSASPNLATTNNLGSFLSSIAPSIYNPGPFTIGPVTTPKLPASCTVNGSNVCTVTGGVITKPPQPGSAPFGTIQGIQLPFWTVNNGSPVPFG